MHLRNDKLEAAEVRAKLYDHECEFNRRALTDARKMVGSSDVNDQRTGIGMYIRHIQINDAHELNICAPEGLWVGAWCANGDRACVLHELDWALAFVR